MEHRTTPLFHDSDLPLLAVDPGKRYAGLALFRGKTLWDAGRPDPGDGVREPNDVLTEMTSRAVVEWARDRGGRFNCCAEFMQARGRSFKTTSLLELNAVSGWACGAADNGYLVQVKDWKSTYTKAMIAAWVARELGSTEEQLLAGILAPMSPDQRSDVVDAVGIGLWAVGRDVRLHKGA